MRTLSLLVVATLALLTAPAAANAAARTWHAPDPVDRTPALAGPALHDITAVDVALDPDSGTLQTWTTFASPTYLTDERVEVSIGKMLGSPGDTWRECSSQAALTTYLSSGGSLLMANGYTGTAPGNVQRSVSADSRTIYSVVQHPALLGSAADCVKAQLYAYDEFGHCGNSSCSVWSYRYERDAVASVMYHGYTAPTPSPTPTPDPVGEQEPKPKHPKHCGSVYDSDAELSYDVLRYKKATCAAAMRVARKEMKLRKLPGTWRCNATRKNHKYQGRDTSYRCGAGKKRGRINQMPKQFFIAIQP